MSDSQREISISTENWIPSAKEILGVKGEAKILGCSALHVSKNLPRLAADLAAHLKALEHADDLRDLGSQSEDFLEPYNLPPDDEHWVITIAWGEQCVDCGDTRDYYLVNDTVWAEAGLKPRQCCCRKCLAARLGRPLEPRDLLICPANTRMEVQPTEATPEPMDADLR